MPGDDRRDHKLTNFGKLKLEGFGPEATEIAPVSAQLHNTINDLSLLVYLQTLLHNAPRKLPNSVKLRRGQGYYAV